MKGKHQFWPSRSEWACLDCGITANKAKPNCIGGWRRSLLGLAYLWVLIVGVLLAVESFRRGEPVLAVFCVVMTGGILNFLRVES